VGDYVLTYNVVDFAGNAAAPITRTVSVTTAPGKGGGGVISIFSLISLLIFLLVSHRNRATHSREQKVL